MHICIDWLKLQFAPSVAKSTLRRACARTLQMLYDHVEAAKNEENYLGDDVADDNEFLVRTKWVVKKCPFPGLPTCSYPAWKRANCWSLISAEQALAYCKQHGKNSKLHWNGNVGLTDEEINTHLVDVEVEEVQDTFSEREAYRQQLATINTNKRDWWDTEGGEGGDSWQGGAKGNRKRGWAAEAPMTELQQTLGTLAESMQTMTQAISSVADQRQQQPGTFGGPQQQPGTFGGPLQQQPPPLAQWAAQQADMVAADAAAWDPSMQIAMQEKTIAMPYSKALLLKESIQRAKESCKQGMASMLTPLNQLKAEYVVLNNGEQVLNQLLEAGKWQTLWSHLSLCLLSSCVRTCCIYVRAHNVLQACGCETLSHWASATLMG